MTNVLRLEWEHRVKTVRRVQAATLRSVRRKRVHSASVQTDPGHTAGVRHKGHVRSASPPCYQQDTQSSPSSAGCDIIELQLRQNVKSDRNFPAITAPRRRVSAHRWEAGLMVPSSTVGYILLTTNTQMSHYKDAGIEK